MKVKLILLLLITVTLSGCLFKSVTKGDADDIESAMVYDDEGAGYLVTLEKVYQATSKEYNKGLSLTTGFNVLRISVYDLNDGALIKRMKIGRQTTHAVEFLGWSKGNLWMYSFDRGIHSVNPLTLEVNISQEDIMAKNPDLQGNLVKCEWYQLSQYFQFNDVTGKIILTDEKGNRYILDPESLVAAMISYEYYPFNPGRDQPFVTRFRYGMSNYSLSGDLRKQIKLDNKETNTGLTFLDGSFIADRDPSRLIEKLDNELSKHMVKMESIYPAIMHLNSLNGGAGPAWGDAGRDSLILLEKTRYEHEYQIKNLKRYRTEILKTGMSHSFNQALSPDTNAFFIFHKSGIQEEALAAVSMIQRRNDGELVKLWEVEVEDLFFEPDEAGDTSAFREVFSSGSPEYDFSIFDLHERKLIIVWMLHITCIDTETGKVLWKVKV